MAVDLYRGNAAKATWIAIGIPNANCGNQRVARQDMGAPITHSLTAAGMTQLQDAGIPSHHGLQRCSLLSRDTSDASVSRVRAIERNAGPGHVEVKGWAKQHPTAVGKAGPRFWEKGPQGVKGSQLLAVAGCISCLGAAQMAHQIDQLNPLKRVRPILQMFDQPIRLIRREAEPCHAGVDMQCGWNGDIMASGQHAEPGNLAEVIDHWRQPMGKIGVLLSCMAAGETENG